jgi:prepilin-type N-terminal cleavage/methylation domain-containing protein
MRGQRAFTLIELVAVMAILAILVAIVAPSATNIQKAGTRAQAQADSQQVRSAVTDYFKDQRAAEVRTPHTVTFATLVNGKGVIDRSQFVSSKWPEKFITAEVGSAFVGRAKYADVFPTVGSATDGIVVGVTLANENGEEIPVGSGGPTDSIPVTAIDLERLVDEGFLSELPRGASRTTEAVSGVELPNFLWLFAKTTSSRGPNGDNREVVVFSLDKVAQLEAAGLQPTQVELSYRQIVGRSAASVPFAIPQSVTTGEDLVKLITLRGFDVNGGPLTFRVVSLPANGSLRDGATAITTVPHELSGAITTYIPNVNFRGNDSFTFKVNDGSVDSLTATVSINVISVNDVPIAIGRSVSTNEDTTTAFSLDGSDADGDALTFSVATGPVNGVLGGTPPNLTYTPNADFNGSDALTFRVSDGTATSSPATVSITVVAVNDPPFFDGIANRAVNVDAPTQNVTITGIAPGPTNEAGQTVTLTTTSSDPAIVPNPTISGTGATRTLSYQPVANASGTATITVTANDGQSQNNTFFRTFTITITITVATLEVVVPNAAAATEGNSGNVYPFNQGTGARRYQQVYDASEIGRSGIIDKIAFRRDAGAAPFFASGATVEFRLSHTTKAPDGLSPTFANNIGANETIVLNTSNLSLSSIGSCTVGPCPFDIVVDLDNIFGYNGIDNLLLDIRFVSSTNTNTLFDAVYTIGDGVSRVQTASDTPSGNPDTLGLVTKFTFIPTP